MGIEAERHLAFHCSLGPDILLVRHFQGTEQLGQPFEYVLTLFSKDANIQAEALLGQHASVRMKVGSQPERFFDGVVCEFGVQGYSRAYIVYRMVLRPWLWLLTRTCECRVFQRLTTVDIFKQIAKDKWGFTDLDDRVIGQLPEREYCVQYQESDYNFLMRLMEEDGLYYFFRHELGKHDLVLADSISAHETVEGFDTIHYQRVSKVDHERPEGAMLSWTSTTRVQPGRVAQRDFDFEKPLANLDAITDNPKDHEQADAEIFEWPGHYVEASVGQERTRIRLEEIQASYAAAEGSTDASGIYAGCLFSLQDHPRGVENREYLVTSIVYNTDSGSFESGSSSTRFSAHIRALDSSVPYRSARHTRAPVIAGVQTATVVGPKGSEIWTEKYGRVKVQFHWDRYGEKNENSSCWVRVAQVWAGTNWGAQFIPRIGQEVVVEFVDGNPDKPLIIGSVYNDTHKVPFDLPKQQTQSGIRTRSTKEGGTNDFNELRFEDERGAEQVTLHAQRDYAISVENDETNQVENNLSVSVEKGYYSTVVKKGYKRTEVTSDKSELHAVEIFENADKQIVLTVGPCEIVIDPSMIQLTAFQTNQITLDATGVTITGTGGTVSVNAAGVAATGPSVKMNALG